MRFAFIEAEKAWPVSVMCRVLKVSRSGFYAYLKRPESHRSSEDRRLGVLCIAAHEESRRTYGSPRVFKELKANGVRISKKRVDRLLKARDVRVRPRRRWVTTTDSGHGLAVAPNLLNRDFRPAKPDERWAADVTYLSTPSGFMYLAVVIDLFSRFVVGWALSPHNDRHLAMKALTMATSRRQPTPGLLHHTDRGSPYASEDFQKMLTQNGMVCSMSRVGNCWDNAVVESFFKTFKAELGESFESASEARRLTFDYIEVFFNQKRRHSTLGYVSPAAYEKPISSLRQAA